ncbi:MAG: curli assembly protein CsgF [bacterium]|nr:curli assembly protein CsgF [bacterium]
MNHILLSGLLLASVFPGFVSSVSADELTYKPINPSFGGNPFNGSYLMSTASEQKGFKAPEKKRNPVDEFSETVTSSLLSRISRDVAEQILGENAQESGSFTLGETVLNFHRENGEVVINVQDAANGGATTIKLPAIQY